MTTRSAIKPLLAATVFLGATLLFIVQPMVAKAILPWFGGSAAVWTTAVLLFQSLLLGGYLYAHLSTRTLGRRSQLWLHLAILACALALLPAIPPQSLAPAAATSPIARVLLVLLVTVGLPFFVLSSTSTLAQAWWHRVDPLSHPYRLYALSNAGSLLGLLAYPVLVEPLIGVRQQAYAWSAAMCLYAILSGTCAYLVARSPAVGDQPRERIRPARLGNLAWLLWPAASSLLLLALTASMSERIAPIPFLWILPLSLYLLSFIICFERPGWYSRAVFIPAYMLLLLADSLLIVLALRPAIWQQLALTSALLFVGCMICHGELYRTRPAASGLTFFYLVTALGSVIGSVLAAVVAPLTFPARWELHLALALIAMLMLLVLWTARDSRLRAGRPRLAWFGIGIWLGIAGLLLWLDASGSYGMTTLVTRQRSFYGEITVRDAYRKEFDTQVRTLYHDGVVHGLQMLDPKRSQEPMNYYWQESGLGRLLRATESQAARKIGVVGLGAGAIASWGRETDRMVFYELDPLMIDIARTQFTYLSGARAAIEIIPGDARLSLQAQTDQQFDLLILDAFSGNALPVHLLTSEAMATYLRHLKPDGVLAVHISNHYLDLEPVIARLAESTGLNARILSTPAGIPRDLRNETDVALFSRSGASLEHELIREVAHRPQAKENVRLWTDDYSNLLPTLK